MSSGDSDIDSTHDDDGSQTLQLDVPSGAPVLTEVDIGEADDLSGHSGGEDYLPTHSPALREQDRFLPIANISRIMKRVLPESGKVAKDAKECSQECVSEFVSFITSEASERCQNEKRKTINGEDILWAMQTLGFDQYVEPLKLYLAKYREAAKGDKVPQAPPKEGEQYRGTQPALQSEGYFLAPGSSNGR